MQTQFEYDLLGYPPRSRGTVDAAVAALEGKLPPSSENSQVPGFSADEALGVDGDDECACGDEDCGEEGGDDGDGEEGDVEMGGDDSLLETTASLDDPISPTSGAADTSDETNEVADGEDSGEGKSKPDKKKSGRSKSSPPKLSDRLAAMSKPKPAPKEPEKETFQPEKKAEKKPKASRPSLLLRLRPTNLEESKERFFASGYTEAPRFTYAYDEEEVQKAFEDNSDVCFELLPEAKRILQKVQDEYGGPEAFLQKLYGTEKISSEEMRAEIDAYIKDHHVEDKVEIRIVESSLSAANVVKPGDGGKYIVNIASTPISKTLVPGICDHEVGTHLLRMMNDEHQAWHGRRDNYKLSNPWTTEEGFATLNTYQTMPVKLMYTQALGYWSVCRGAQIGFVELFKEISEYVSDPNRVWQKCVRIKRGMTDTSLPGAFYMDQAYFKGAVEILRHLDEVDFGRLYGGQLALQDLDKVHFIQRKEVVRLPRFMSTPKKMETYMVHCRKMIKENGIQAAVERVCKRVFVATAKEFFKTKPKQSVLRTTVTLGEGSASDGNGGSTASKTLDLSRLLDMAKPRQVKDSQSDIDKGADSDTTASRPRRTLDLSRLSQMSRPRETADAETEDDKANDSGKAWRALDLKHIQSLAKPRQVAAPTEKAQTAAKPVDVARLLELSAPRTSTPRQGSRASSASEVPPPPPPFPQQPDFERLAALAAPRKCATGVDGGEPCACPPTKAKKKRGKRSRHRIIAMVQQKRDEEGGEAGGGDEAEEAAEAEEDDSETVVLAEVSSNPLPVVAEESSRTGSPVDSSQDVRAIASPATAAVVEEQSPHTSEQDANRAITVSPNDAAAIAQEQLPAAPEECTQVTPSNHVASPDGAIERNASEGSLDRPSASSQSHRPKRASSRSSDTRVVAASVLDGDLGIASSEPPNVVKLSSERRPSRRAVARARSVGLDASASSVAAASVPLNGGNDRGLSVGGHTRRQRLPIGLPKGAAAASVNAAFATGAAAEPPLFKAVPIQMFQLGI